MSDKQKTGGNLLAYGVELSLVGTQAFEWGTQFSHQKEKETKRMLLILIRNMQSWSSKSLCGVHSRPVSEVFAFNPQENLFYYPISFYFISSEVL